MKDVINISFFYRFCKPWASHTIPVASAAASVTSAWTGCRSRSTWTTRSIALTTTTGCSPPNAPLAEKVWKISVTSFDIWQIWLETKRSLNLMLSSHWGLQKSNCTVFLLQFVALLIAVNAILWVNVDTMFKNRSSSYNKVIERFWTI